MVGLAVTAAVIVITALTTTVDAKRGFELSLPPGWAAASESLTPDLGDPRELLSVGTFPLRYRASACNHLPAGALATMGPADGFVTVQERGRGAGSVEFVDRPARFADVATPMGGGGDFAGCLGGDAGLVAYWIPFTDAGRHFYAQVVLGVQAPADVRAQAFEILDRLRFDPAVRPTWRSSG